MAQDAPFEGHHKLWPEDEIIVAVLPHEASPSEGFPASATQHLLDFDGSATLVELEVATHETVRDILHDGYASPPTGAASGSLDGDREDEFAFLWKGKDTTLALAVSGLGGPSSVAAPIYPDLHAAGLPLRYADEEDFRTRDMDLVIANIDGKAGDELAVVYFDAQKDVRLAVVSLDEAGVPTVRAQTVVMQYKPTVALGSRLSEAFIWDMDAADFDGDGAYELVLSRVMPINEADPSPDPDWKLHLSLYRLDSAAATLDKVAETASPVLSDVKGSGGGRSLISVELAAADYDGDGAPEVGIVYFTGYSSYSTGARFYELNAEGDVFQPVASAFGVSGWWPSCVSAGDVDGDQNAELIVQTEDALLVYDYDHTMMDYWGYSSSGFSSKHPDPASAAPQSIVVTDLDPSFTEPLQSEIVIAYHWAGSSWVEVYRHGEPTLVASAELNVAYGVQQAVALTTADVDGDSLALGAPSVYTRRDIVQPLVILNAPPRHFDVLDGMTYDLATCFQDECARATYTKLDEIVQEVSTESHSDWALSDTFTESVSGTLGPIGARVEEQLSQTYGKGFSKRQGRRTSTTTTFRVSAIDVDQIIAKVADYEVWEYPVYSEGELQGNVVAVVPLNPELAAFGVKSQDADAYVPRHENGNILSYRPMNSQAEDQGVSRYVTLSQGYLWTMQSSGQSDYTWSLGNASESLLSNESSSFISREQKIDYGLNLGVEIPVVGDILGSLGFGINMGAASNSSYEIEQVSTTSVQVQSSQTLNVVFGNVDGSVLGNHTWQVKPYIYWAENGALVLDYSVEPSRGQQGSSWFVQNYGSKPDLALLLPWRLDKDKGLATSDDELDLTRNIVINPREPQAGEVVDILVRVHNYTMQTIDSPASVLRLYVGAPDAGGELIVNESGQSDVVIPSIPPRGYRVLALRHWLVPYGLNPSSRIYAVIDPDDTIDEIHEDNNRGWAFIRAVGSNLWPDADRVEDGWKRSRWMGWLYDSGIPYVYQVEAGHLWVASNSTPESLFYYDLGLAAWIWTSPEFYPFLYWYGDLGGWLYYARGGAPDDRWFYNYRQEAWVHEPDMQP